jgi:DNA polymerase IV
VRSLAGWTDSTTTIYDTATELYRSLELDRPRVRMVGIKCENFRDAAAVSEQLTLDAAPGSVREDAARAMDAARARFGAGALQFGTLLPIPAQTDAQRPAG